MSAEIKSADGEFVGIGDTIIYVVEHDGMQYMRPGIVTFVHAYGADDMDELFRVDAVVFPGNGFVDMKMIPYSGEPEPNTFHVAR